MAFDGIVTKQVVYELNSLLIGGKINKIFQPSKNEILFIIYANSKHFTLLVNIDANNYRIHLTSFSKPNPLNAPNFCMLLRKHLIGMRIKSFKTYDLERIVKIVLEGYDELNDITTKELVIELMGKHSNIILLNSSNKIIDSMRHLETSSHSIRDILPAREYVLPSSSKKSFLELQSFEEFEPYANTISSNFIGISKLLVSYLAQKHNSALEIYEVLKNIVSSNSLGCIPFSNDYVIDIIEETNNLKVNNFLDNFYNQREIQNNFISYRNSVLKLILNELKKYSKRLLNMNSKLEECNKKEQYKLFGELITANLYNLDADKKLENIELENYYQDNKIVSIPLDKSISISMNAKKYFKKYAKLKNAYEIVTLQKEETKKEIEYIESVIYELENAKTISDIDSIYTEFSESFLGKSLNVEKSKKKTSKKKKEELFSPLTYIIDGYTVLVGKNNTQNDYLTLKYAHTHDLWFHTKDIHGSHVVLKTEEKEIPQNTINKCASLAAFHSKAKNSSNVPVDYTFIRHVKKQPNSKPGMVIYTNFHTVNVYPKDFDLCQFR